MPPAAAASRQRRAPAPRARRGGIRWDRVGRLALLGTLILICALYVPPATKWIKQRGTEGHQQERLAELKSENAQLKGRVRQLRSPAALELEARRMGMVEVGEKAYVIENLRKAGGG
jgi:cell division protein FtsB